jgi:uncharacterized lipoprotein YddW (UPF0748 family)
MPPRATRRLVLMCLTVLAAVPLAAAPAGELRGLWVVRTALLTPESVDRVVDDAAAAGFNALFVQVRGRGDAFYSSRIVPRSVLLEHQPASFDPLERLIARARTRGLQVHAWVNILLVAHFGQPVPHGHVLEGHPDWAMVPRPEAGAALRVWGRRRLQLIAQAGRAEDAEGYYLSPSIPAVGRRLEAVVRELVRTYPVDGLHLDFIRYPGPAWDYSRAALEGFQHEQGGGDLLNGPAEAPEKWEQYQRRTLTALAARLADAARVERPGLVLSAAVAPDEAQAVHHKFQDWPLWMSRGILTALCPMAYTPDSRLFVSQVEQALTRAHRDQVVWAGIGAYRLDVDGIAEKVELAREAGAGGVVLFSHESLRPEDWERLRDKAFPSRVDAAAARPVTARPATAGSGAR